ncbi:MAG: AAA family ATPase [Clostridia bacterium]|nr:AAA family ATPase [Clostridia bacterium]
MNIKEAKEEIKNAMTAYFSKDEFGRYVIPIEKQRPIFLLGAPGIGKTAIMEQIAGELGVGLVSYSMTHHTRQSALGLPYIERKTYGGKEYAVSEYTMSEIIASVYNMMEETGKKEGILFLDEINCVSETLAPSMLQFLQYKVFGNHRVPDGWIVVTAGNPPEYNNSVREFDIATWDRLKRVDVEADYTVWKEYALNSGVHPAVLSYLELKKADFYKIESTVDGKRFVTARGWSDLSAMICLYEQHNLPVTRRLVGQYLQNDKIAKEFSVYYDLFLKYRSDYQINKILDGEDLPEVVSRARNAKFDERLAVVSLLISGLTGRAAEVSDTQKALAKVLEALSNCRIAVSANKDFVEAIGGEQAALRAKLQADTQAQSMPAEERICHLRAIGILDEMSVALAKEHPADAAQAFVLLKKDYDERVKALKKKAERVGKAFQNAFTFLEKAVADGQEMVIFVTELTLSVACSWFVSRYGCDKYFAHSKELRFHERQLSIIHEIQEANDQLRELMLE